MLTMNISLTPELAILSIEGDSGCTIRPAVVHEDCDFSRSRMKSAGCVIIELRREIQRGIRQSGG